MIYIFIALAIVSFIVFLVTEDKIYSLIPSVCAILVLVGILGIVITAISYNEGDTIKLKNTISKEEFSIVNFDKTETAISKHKDKGIVTTYTYTIENTNDNKTISEEDDSVYSITVSQSKNINHLTIKHNLYYDAATLSTIQKDVYVFSSK